MVHLCVFNHLWTTLELHNKQIKIYQVWDKFIVVFGLFMGFDDNKKKDECHQPFFLLPNLTFMEIDGLFCGFLFSSSHLQFSSSLHSSFHITASPL